MIELFSADTPNGKKISIMLEEIDYEYKVIKLDLSKGDQFKTEFKGREAGVGYWLLGIPFTTGTAIS